jgi:hypothetical protein
MKVRSFVRSALACGLCIGGAAGVASACTGSDPTAVYFDGGRTYRDGGSHGYCSGSQALEIAADDCSGCTGSTAFALCNGASYTECACAIPNGYSLDGGFIDGGQGEPAKGVIGFGGGAGLPCCAGNEVFEIPAAACAGANCRGIEASLVAYAVCQDNAYSGCACDIPEGYSLPDGPGPCNQD